MARTIMLIDFGPPNAHVAIAGGIPRLIAGAVDTLLSYS